jgi:signal transduction histidine kinase
VDLVQLIRDVVDASVPLAKDRPYSVQGNLPSTPLRVRTDPVLVRQILTNLLSNAIKFTPKGSVEVSLWPAENNDVYVEVKDTGIGIRPEHLVVIFDEFRQIDGSSTRQHGGTGLGLAISKKFANLLGGDILVTSTYEQGSCFTLVLKDAKIAATGEHLLPEVTASIGEGDVGRQ